MKGTKTKHSNSVCAILVDLTMSWEPVMNVPLKLHEWKVERCLTPPSPPLAPVKFNSSDEQIA